MDTIESSDQPPIRPMAVVMFERPYQPDVEALATAIHGHHPDLAVEVCSPPSMHTPLLRCGGELVTLISLPGPVLPHADNPTWLRASMVWPEARTDGVRHSGHVVVSTIGTRTPRLRTARILTAVTGALIAAAPGVCAVAWDGRTTRSAKMWLTEARNAFAPYPSYPFTQWIDIVPFRSRATFGAVTMGLSAFVGREIEYETERADLTDILNKIAGLAIYLIEHGPVIHDGNTFGESETERLLVRHVTSTRFPGLPVLHARSQGADSASETKNLDHLLTDQEVASFVGLLPDDDGVLPSYLNVVRTFLDNHSQSPGGIDAEAGVVEGTHYIADAVEGMQSAMQQALPKGELFAFWPPIN